MERLLQGKWLFATRYVCIAYALFHLYTSGFGLLPDMQQRAAHVFFATALTFLMFSAVKRGKAEAKVPIWDLLLIGVVITSCVNVFIKYISMLVDPMQATNFTLFLGVAIIILVLETGRRVVGWVFPALTLAFLLYALFGQYIPGDFGHAGFKWDFIIKHLYQSDVGVWGYITGISAMIVSIFMILGGLLLHCGAGETFIALAIRLTGKLRGGPALTAVVASSMFGTICGGSLDNVVATGNITIPMMKRLGYKPEFAGGVETTASCGGPLMPPIMGTGAFIMAQILAISYVQVIIVAIIPAIIYYVGVFSSVRFESLRLNLAPIPDEEIPSWRQILTWGRMAPLVIPFTILIVLLLQGYYIATCAFWACVSLIVLFLFSSFSLLQIRQRAGMMVDGLERGGKILASVVPLLVCANIVMSLINLTGVGVKISSLIMSAAGGSMLLALVFAAIGCIVIGMGLPTSCAYVLGVAVLYPAIVQIGFLPLVGHFFIFYWTAVSTVTPPVCLAAFAAGAIAQTSWLKVAWVGMRLGIVVYMLPFVFSYEPALLLFGTPQEILMVSLSALVGVVFLSAGVWGYLTTRLSIFIRVLFGGGALMLLITGINY
ncbi:TRAP transporter permease [Candidatus Omnitrophota bacterium]